LTKVVHIPDEKGYLTYHDEKTEFKNDVHLGLTKSRKQINSKYFYDEHGCELFNQITRHKDYYLTRSEIEILDHCKEKISHFLSKESFNLVELGPGEGLKTKILMDHFLQKNFNFTYIPIDISTRYLLLLMKQMKQQLPELQLIPVHADYFRGLEWLSAHSCLQNVVLFLGSSIGNFDPTATNEFLLHLREALNEGDYVLLGFDLRKDIEILLRAYNDQSGLTREFNLNLLSRINREFSGNFDLNQFHHYAAYNVYSGAMESYLVSLKRQIVNLGVLNRSYSFEEIEPIHVEYSHKYLFREVEQLAVSSGFEILQNFTDKNQYFLDSLWRVCK
jgi:L-histidine Nalpha-methyltransferase